MLSRPLINYKGIEGEFTEMVKFKDLRDTLWDRKMFGFCLLELFTKLKTILYTFVHISNENKYKG